MDADMENIILLGTGGHAHSVVDSIEQAGQYRIIGFLDREEMQGKNYRDYPVLGMDEDLDRYYKDGVKNAFVTVGFMGQGAIREQLYQRLKDVGYRLPNIIDDTAVVSGSAELADGIFIGKKAVINANVKIDRMCIVNTGAIVEHDCMIKAFSHISVGSVLCGNVQIEEASFVGANATVIQGLSIGKRCVIGAGTTVRRNVEEYCMVKNEKVVKILEGRGECFR